MTHQPDPFAHAETTARAWLDIVATRLGTTDRRHAYRALRAWLHVLRDRLSVDAAAHLGAQLPELLRGLFFEGWRPSQVPIRYGVGEFVDHYAREAGIAPDDVSVAVIGVTEALRDRFSPGQLDHTLAQLPQPLRALLTTHAADVPPGDGARHGAELDDHARLQRLERTVTLLVDAMSELAHGLETNPLDEPEGERAARTASEVRRLLLGRDDEATFGP